MDKEFWQAIVDAGYALPAGYTAADLIPHLLANLASPDPHLRERLTYDTLVRWMENGYYSPADLRAIVSHLTANFGVGLGEEDADSVFGRSFSAMILAEMLYYGRQHPFLDDTGVLAVLDAALAYLDAERDVWGYAPDKGWVHAIAHCADLLWMLAQHSALGAAELQRILDGIAAKITAPGAHIYLHDEDERLVRAVMAALQRDLLGVPFLTLWLERFTHPVDGPSWTGEVTAIKTYRHVREYCARHNAKCFLRSLYFQLVYPGMGSLRFVDAAPPVAAALIPRITATLGDITVWA